MTWWLLWVWLWIAPAQAAGVVHLFQVIKPVNPENLIQVDALLPNSCKIEDLDFYYLMDGTRPKRSMLESSIRKWIPFGEAHGKHRADCPKRPLESCQTLAVKLPFLDKVEHSLRDPSLLVRAEKEGRTCTVGAYLDVGKKIVQLTRLIARGERQSLNIFRRSAKIRIDSVTVEGKDGYAATWRCAKDCVAELKM